MNDDSTDKLFQEGAKRYEFEYNPDAWQQMEQLLDQDKAKRRRLWLAGFIFFLLNALFIWWYVASRPNVPAVQAESNGDIPAEQITSEKLKSITPTNPETEGILGEEINAPAPQTVISEVTTSASDSPTQIQSAAPTPKVTAQKDGNNARENDPVAVTSTTTQAPAAIQDAPKQLAQPAVGSNTTTATAKTTLQVIDELPAKHFALTIVQPALVTPEVNNTERIIPASPSSNGLFLTAGVGRIYGGGGEMNFEQGENRFGLQLGYRFGKKFDFQAGAHYSNLSYCTEGQDYTASPGFWTDGIVATVVEAECQILEIPLLFTYYPAGNTNNGFYFTGGLNSYFLIREEFKFNYDVPRTDLISSWREDNTNRHIFGYGQFNVGYEKRLTNKTALQLESFVQVPFSGIGQGRVNLVNIGMSANFLFDFRK